MAPGHDGRAGCPGVGSEAVLGDGPALRPNKAGSWVQGFAMETKGVGCAWETLLLGRWPVLPTTDLNNSESEPLSSRESRACVRATKSGTEPNGTGSATPAVWPPTAAPVTELQYSHLSLGSFLKGQPR